MTQSQVTNLPIPPGWEEVPKNERYFDDTMYVSIWMRREITNWITVGKCNTEGHSIEHVGKDYRFIRPILTPEAKLQRLKDEAHTFVKKNLPKPTKEDFEKFEAAFIRGGNHGM